MFRLEESFENYYKKLEEQCLDEWVDKRSSMSAPWADGSRSPVPGANKKISKDQYERELAKALDEVENLPEYQQGKANIKNKIKELDDRVEFPEREANLMQWIEDYKRSIIDDIESKDPIEFYDPKPGDIYGKLSDGTFKKINSLILKELQKLPNEKWADKLSEYWRKNVEYIYTIPKNIDEISDEFKQYINDYFKAEIEHQKYLKNNIAKTEKELSELRARNLEPISRREASYEKMRLETEIRHLKKELAVELVKNKFNL